MAKLGQKFSKYSEEFKVNVILYANENGVTKAYKKYKVPMGTIGTWQSIYRTDNNLCINTKSKEDKSELENLKEKYESLKKSLTSWETTCLKRKK
ncbi:hypothetical protein [Spiroplasma endosymbiont of Atherix ibis]|uniref:hypothetical protein n=1 Tax=Spiroplasma endosymbiont of Atherix ibis TaxID=3066291 RepID=UPI0030CBE87A